MRPLVAKPFKLVVVSAALLSAVLFSGVPAFGVTVDPSCPSSPVAFDPNVNPSVYQTPINASVPFELKVIAVMLPGTDPNNNLALLYQATQDGKVYYNPTLVVKVGAKIKFVLRDCLTPDDVKNLQSFLPKTAADTPAPTPYESFKVDQADEMVPSGYSNFHSHGLGGKPKRAILGQPGAEAGDEVVGTFVSAIRADGTSSDGYNWQKYEIKVPEEMGKFAAQDAGLYWYHPHFHGESQQAVFLGLTGAIVVVDPGTAVSSPSDLQAAAGTVLVVRDRPLSNKPFRPLPAPAGEALANGAVAANNQPLVHTRQRFFAAMRSSRSPMTTAEPAVSSPAPVPPSSAPVAPAPPAPVAGTATGADLRPMAAMEMGIKAAVEAPPTVPPNPTCVLFGAANGAAGCLPDNVSGVPSAAQLATLVTVNGVKTETPDTYDSSTVSLLTFKPIPVTTGYPLRVLNASANTYLKLALVAGVAPGQIDLPHPKLKLHLLQLTVISRDGHPLSLLKPRNAKMILLPPGSRAEFEPASGQGGVVSLVSQYVNTGPAGDLVPYRVLATVTPATAAGTGASVGEKTVELAAAKGAVAAQSTVVTTVPKLTRYAEAFRENDSGTLPTKHRAFAFFEQDRACTPDSACGTSFYLIDITASVYGDDHGTKMAVMEAKPFQMPMKKNPDKKMNPDKTMVMNSDGTMEIDWKKLFDGKGGKFNDAIPSVQVALHKQDQVNEIWDIYNFTAEYHAFHIHQLGFGVKQTCAPQYLTDQGVSPDCELVQGDTGDENKEANLLLDVVNVPYAVSVANPNDANGNKVNPTIYPGKVTLNVPFSQSIVGDFVLHCHLLEHEDNGMMLGIQVWPDEIPK